jgi:hypothetical protein
VAASQRKIEANRANALKSTGPRTPRGRRAAGRNALAHGLTSRAALLPGDDPREYRRFVRALLVEMDPRGPFQEELVGEIAHLSWKLRRAPTAEAILLAEKHRRGEELPPTKVLVNMILDKKSYDGSPASPLWLLDRYTQQIERSRARALRMFLAVRKHDQSLERAEAEPAGIRDVAARAIFPLQNEANCPAASRGTQAQPPQPDGTTGASRDSRDEAPQEPTAEGP